MLPTTPLLDESAGQGGDRQDGAGGAEAAARVNETGTAFALARPKPAALSTGRTRCRMLDIEDRLAARALQYEPADYSLSAALVFRGAWDAPTHNLTSQRGWEEWAREQGRRRDG